MKKEETIQEILKNNIIKLFNENIRDNFYDELLTQCGITSSEADEELDIFLIKLKQLN